MPSQQLAVFAIADDAIVSRFRDRRWRGHGELVASLSARTGRRVHPGELVLGDLRTDGHGTYARVGPLPDTITRETVKRVLRTAFTAHEPFEIEFDRRSRGNRPGAAESAPSTRSPRPILEP